MLLINPPVAKPCEPPASIACIAGALRAHAIPCTLLDANLEAQLHCLGASPALTDTWSRRARQNMHDNLKALRTSELYENRDRYLRAVKDVNRLLENAGKEVKVQFNLANYHDPGLSCLDSRDLLQCAEQPKTNIFYHYFSKRLPRILDACQPQLVGISVNYLSQANNAFALIGFLKQLDPHLPVILGGGLVSSWMRNPHWLNPFGGLVDHLVAGPGEVPLLKMLGRENISCDFMPDYEGLPLNAYLSPGLILPYAASSGCYWKKCSFCPEKAEDAPYWSLRPEKVLADLKKLIAKTRPALLHFLDNAMSPALMKGLIADPPDVDWYSFARVGPMLTDVEFCKKLRKSGCVMLKLGLESGNQRVLDAMEKGIDLVMVEQALTALEKAGIATYVYLLFGTPSESIREARETMAFIVRNHRAITFLNLAIFNLPKSSPDAKDLDVHDFYEGDLSLYTDFKHPLGWDRQQIRLFLDKELKRHPVIAPIVQRDPYLFTSNHAPFMC